MRRTLEPEMLDSLPPDHPDALHNRRDLRLTNFVMGNHRWIERTARGILHRGERALEIGAGTGELGLRLNRAGAEVDGLDLWSRPAEWPAARAWHKADLLDFNGYGTYGAIIANLILHQFSEADLAQLGSRIDAQARLVIACEPVRRRASQAMFATVAPLFGANRVSRHDARVSIAAGFRDDELPRALGLDPARWSWRCSTTLRGAYRLIAVKRK